MSFSIVIIDDDSVFGEITKKFCSKMPEVQLKAYFDEPVALRSFLRTNDVDLVITDVEMPSITGIELVKELGDNYLYIFMTAHKDFAAEAFDLNGIDYLVKPVTFERFQRAINKAIEYKKSKQSLEELTKSEDVVALNSVYQQEQDHFFIKTDSQFIKLSYNDVLFIEAMKDFVKIYTYKSHHVAYMTLKILEEELPSDIFIRTHRSFIANMKKIDSLTQSDIKMADYMIPLGNLYKDAVFSTLVEKNLIKR